MYSNKLWVYSTLNKYRFIYKIIHSENYIDQHRNSNNRKALVRHQKPPTENVFESFLVYIYIYITYALLIKRFTK